MSIDCEFKTNFEITKEKVNLLSATFFYMPEMYKDPNFYLDSLKNIVDIFLKTKDSYKIPNYKFRLYHDDSIFLKENAKEVKKFIKYLSTNDSIQLVNYSCDKYRIKGNKKYHRPVFGTIMRFFTFFDYPCNDNVETTTTTDIDFTDEHIATFTSVMKQHEYFYNIYIDGYSYIYETTREIKRCVDMKYCAIAECIYFRQKIAHERLDEFLEISKSKNKPEYITTLKNLGVSNPKIKATEDDFWIYGVDEILMGKIINELISEDKISFAYIIRPYNFNDMYKVRLEHVKKIVGENNKTWDILLQDFRPTETAQLTTREKLDIFIELFSLHFNKEDNNKNQTFAYNNLKKRIQYYMNKFNKLPPGINQANVKFFIATFITPSNSAYILFKDKKISINVEYPFKNKINNDIMNYVDYTSKKYKVNKRILLDNFVGR